MRRTQPILLNSLTILSAILCCALWYPWPSVIQMGQYFMTFDRGYVALGHQQRGFLFSAWRPIAVIATLILPATAFDRWYRSRRERRIAQQQGCCARCGYDLRATPHHCPECGPMPTAYIALGANLGDRAQNLRDAIARLDQIPGIQILRVSSFIENPAVGGPEDSPPFLNAAASIQTTFPPETLLAILLETEKFLGRRREIKWGPRTLDLDLLLYDNQILHTQGLTVPHPRMHERDFVLTPLAEIAPDLIHPTLNLTIRDLATRLTPRV